LWSLYWWKRCGGAKWSIYYKYDDVDSAVVEVFPNAKIRGCRFHLGQSWWRKIQSLGHTKIYKTNTDESYYLKIFFFLPFLDSDNVIDCFTDDFLAILPAKDDRVVRFTDYFFKNYISLDVMLTPLDLILRYLSFFDHLHIHLWPGRAHTFDKDCHQGFLHKLATMNLPANLYNIICSFIVINSLHSIRVRIDTGFILKTFQKKLESHKNQLLGLALFNFIFVTISQNYKHISY